jgi:hypothetical protein
MFNKAKDWASSKAASSWLRGAIGKYAELKDLEIDSAGKKVRLLLRPRGENEDIELKVDRYEVIRDRNGAKDRVVVSKVSCSKEWIHLLAADHLVGKQFEIPKVASSLL